MAHFTHGFLAVKNARLKRRKEQEEENMTAYSPEDLENSWEFKIVRNEYGSFRKPEIFQQLLEEESLAGWELVEKLDDSRVRFKRSPKARQNDPMLPAGADPYRSRMGGSSRPFMIGIVAGLLLFSVGLGVFFLIAENNGGASPAIWESITIIPAVLIMIFIGLAAAIRARR